MLAASRNSGGGLPLASLPIGVTGLDPDLLASLDASSHNLDRDHVFPRSLRR